MNKTNIIMNSLVAGTMMTLVAANVAADVPYHKETLRNLEAIMKVPAITTEAGVSSEVVLAPHYMWDAGSMEIRGRRLWVTDEGGKNNLELVNGGQVVSFNLRGGDMRTEVAVGQLPLIKDSAFAPDNFGEDAGRLLVASQAEFGFIGSKDGKQVISSVEPGANGDGDRIFCELPDGAALITDLVAGPEGSPFEGAVFAGTSTNKGIVKVAPGGECTVFAQDLPGWTMGLGFTNDGQHMLVGLKKMKTAWTNDRSRKGVAVKVDATGKVVGAPVATGLDMPLSFAYAPRHWGPYAGQLFITDARDWQNRPPRGNPIKDDAVIYRIDENGEKVVFASGFRNAKGLQFYRNSLFVTDPQGEFAGGHYIFETPEGNLLPDMVTGRELPDSVIYKLTYKGNR